MRFRSKLSRHCGVSKGTVLTKPLMLTACGWSYIGKSYFLPEYDKPKKDRNYGYMAFNNNGERVYIGKTMQEAFEFCLHMYKEYYESHPEDHDWLPDPYNRKVVVSKTIMIKEDNNHDEL